MTEPRQTFPLRANKPNLLADIVAGMDQGQLSRKYGVSREAVSRWVQRNQVEVDALRSKVVVAATDKAIAQKEWRLGELQSHYDQLTAYVNEHGFAESSPKGGRTFAGQLSDARLKTLRAAAEETDQLPRAGTHVDNRIQVLIRQVEGFDPQALG